MCGCFFHCNLIALFLIVVLTNICVVHALQGNKLTTDTTVFVGVLFTVFSLFKSDDWLN